jgi:hypothetical protein
MIAKRKKMAILSVGVPPGIAPDGHCSYNSSAQRLRSPNLIMPQPWEGPFARKKKERR